MRRAMPMPDFSRLAPAWALLRLREFGVARARCPFCGPVFAVRLRAEESAIRCTGCGATPVHWALGMAIHRYVPQLDRADVCELSARGPLAAHLRRRARRAMLSEFFADAAPGTERGGVRCEDVQQLSYADSSFDLATCTEVLEHVPDDAAAFAELRRVLRPGGRLLFTVPLHDAPTLERARLSGNGVEHLAAPVYHRDPLRAGAGILAFRDYGRDIVERLRRAGFTEAWIDDGEPGAAPFGRTRPVICARR
ncbi:MAG TPA: methyltransferase domain-containing protein [Rudaea sp.]|nr:methyltransferase domain-containing protein [Rudaea sp.]